MQLLFIFAVLTVAFGARIPYAHCLVVPAGYAYVIWLSYLYLDEIRAKLETIGAKELSSMAWVLSGLVPVAGLFLWTHAYFGYLEPGILRMGFFVVPIVMTWLIMKYPPGTRLIESANEKASSKTKGDEHA